MRPRSIQPQSNCVKNRFSFTIYINETQELTYFGWGHARLRFPLSLCVQSILQHISAIHSRLTHKIQSIWCDTLLYLLDFWLELFHHWFEKVASGRILARVGHLWGLWNHQLCYPEEMESQSGRTGYAVGRHSLCNNYENNLLLCLKKRELDFFQRLMFGITFWTFINVHFMKRPTCLCENPRKKALVTEMLSFSKIGEICCEHNFFNTF